MKQNRNWSIIYWLISLTNILAVALINLGYPQLRLIDYGSKTLLMPSLMALFYFAGKGISNRYKILMLVALFFSWLGDENLMFAGMPMCFDLRLPLFLAGLLSFLLTHVCYIFYFRGEIKAGGQPHLVVKKPFVIFPVVLLYSFLLGLIFPVLPAFLKIPVAIYATILTTMVLHALNRYGQVPVKSFVFGFAGAALFMLSDGVIAINQFYHPFKLAGLLIMITYITGQYFIVQGAIKANIKQPAVLRD